MSLRAKSQNVSPSGAGLKPVVGATIACQRSGSSGASLPAAVSSGFVSGLLTKSSPYAILTPVFALAFILLVVTTGFRKSVECSLPWATRVQERCECPSTPRGLMGRSVSSQLLMLQSENVRNALTNAAEVANEKGHRGASLEGVPLPRACRAPGLPMEKPLKVYMYDLPEQFNLGMIKAFSRNRDLPDHNATYPGHQHSGEWWLYSDLLKPPEERKSPCPPAAVRVTDASLADVFFVPVFSSLSLIVNHLSKQRKKALGPHAHNDSRMQEQLLDWLEKQEPWKRSQGRDHIIPAQDPNSMWAVHGRISKAVLLVSDFGRMKPFEASLLKDVVLPYVHRVTTLSHADERKLALGPTNRTTLLFFMGNRYRKDGGAVRNELFKGLSSETDMVLREGLQSIEGRRASRVGMRMSQFCLHPAGDTPSACRMFDAIVNLCVPVVVSDQIELPFEDVLDYSRFSVFVSTIDAVRPGYLGQLLRSEAMQQRLPAMQEELRKVRQMFEWDTEDGVVPQVWRKISAKVPWIKEMINRDKRMVAGGLKHCMWKCNAKAGKKARLRILQGKA